MCAAIVAEANNDNRILFLEAAIPYAGRLKTKDKEFHRLLTACDGVKVISDRYVPSCYMNRNRYMVAQSQRVIAVYQRFCRMIRVMIPTASRSISRRVTVKDTSSFFPGIR